MCQTKCFSSHLNCRRLTSYHKDTANCLTHAQRRHQSLSLKLPYNNNNVHYTGQPALTSTSRTGGFCWCKVLVPACPCWRHPAHSDYGENAGVLDSVIYTVSVPLSLKNALKYQNVANNDDQSRKQSGTSIAIFTAVKILWAWLRMNFVSADGDTSSFNPPT